MPIKPENRHRYPADWPAIRARILDRAGHCCEGSPVYPECRAANYAPHPVTGSRVVLTIAHLDHVPENCHGLNLRAWCQRCHLTYDAAHRRHLRIAEKVGINVQAVAWVDGFLQGRVTAAIVEALKAKTPTLPEGFYQGGQGCPFLLAHLKPETPCPFCGWGSPLVLWRDVPARGLTDAEAASRWLDAAEGLPHGGRCHGHPAPFFCFGG